MAVAISLKNRVIINSDTSFKSNNHSNSAMGTPPLFVSTSSDAPLPLTQKNFQY